MKCGSISGFPRALPLPLSVVVLEAVWHYRLWEAVSHLVPNSFASLAGKEDKIGRIYRLEQQ